MKKKLYRQSKETANGGEKWMQRRYGLLSVDLDDTYQNFFQRLTLPTAKAGGFLVQ